MADAMADMTDEVESYCGTSADGIVHHFHQIFLSLLHQDSNLSMSEWLVQERGSKPGVSLHIVRCFGNLRDHHVSLSPGYERWDFSCELTAESS